MHWCGLLRYLCHRYPWLHCSGHCWWVCYTAADYITQICNGKWSFQQKILITCVWDSMSGYTLFFVSVCFTFLVFASSVSFLSFLFLFQILFSQFIHNSWHILYFSCLIHTNGPVTHKLLYVQRTSRCCHLSSVSVVSCQYCHVSLGMKTTHKWFRNNGALTMNVPTNRHWQICSELNTSLVSFHSNSLSSSPLWLVCCLIFRMFPACSDWANAHVQVVLMHALFSL